jgi:hypothetical protein
MEKARIQVAAGAEPPLVSARWDIASVVFCPQGVDVPQREFPLSMHENGNSVQVPEWTKEMCRLTKIQRQDQRDDHRER